MEILRQHLNIGHKVKAWLQMDEEPKHTDTLATKWLKNNKLIFFKVMTFVPSYKSVGRPDKVHENEEAYKYDLAMAVLSGRMGQNSSKLLWEGCGRR